MARILPVLVLVLSIASLGRATTVVRLDLPRLVERAELVVEVRCVGSEALRGADGLISTRTTVLVLGGLRGARVGELVSWLQPGGELGDEGLRVPGLPALAPGDEALLLLTPASSRGVRVPVGLAQGVFRARRDTVDGRLTYERALDGLVLLDERDRGTDAPAPRSVAAPAAADSAPTGRDALLTELTRLIALDDARDAALPTTGNEPDDGLDTKGSRR